MAIFTYLSEVNLYLLLFAGFYYIALRNQSFYSLNRFYLLATSTLSFLMPLIKIDISRTSTVKNNLPVQDIDVAQISSVEEQAFWGLPLLASTFYLAVSAFLLLKFLIKIYKIVSILNKSQYTKRGTVNMIEISSDAGHSFFNYLFINPKASKPNIVEKHEMVHIKQLHSIDVILFEIIAIINWINPLSFWLKKEIKAVHEYIADELTLGAEIDRDEYSEYLISISALKGNMGLGSDIGNKNFLKQRLLQLYSRPSTKQYRLLYLILMPLLFFAAAISALAFEKKFTLVHVELSSMEKSEVTIQQASPLTSSSLLYDRKNNQIKAKQVNENRIKKSSSKREAGSKTSRKLHNTGRARATSFAVLINATTDTVKIRRTNAIAKSKEYKGIYVIGKEIYTHKQLGKALNPAGELDIVLDERPVIGMFTENDKNAITRWGKKAAKGVIFVQTKN